MKIASSLKIFKFPDFFMIFQSNIKFPDFSRFSRLRSNPVIGGKVLHSVTENEALGNTILDYFTKDYFALRIMTLGRIVVNFSRRHFQTKFTQYNKH